MGVRGYKVFDKNWQCRGFQYEVGKTFKHNGDIKICEAGFHFCQEISDCFNYYPFNRSNHVAEIEAIGHVKTSDDKSVTDKITIIRELTWYEVLHLANEGIDCTGYKNTGNKNTGNRNAGYSNTGNCNTGDQNTGNCNISHWNTGRYNTGNWNTGDYNTGVWNAGNCNAGSWNVGNCNEGNCNTGNWNTGNCNTGAWNSINYSSGFFNSIEAPIMAFNKPLFITRKEFLECEGMKVLEWKYENNWWIYSVNMTEEEREAHPEHEVTGGYLKTVDFKTACKMMWDDMDEREKQAVKETPNFDAKVFEEITGIVV